ncbi:hypothetical protein GCM10010531_40810 [Blastococcus jejuensis]|uniref:Uncharacterized protein n=1 Tax=Blastococcus jejuensis TaxID=351224 RepID=A0ABP6PL65_9ACTN
MSTEDELRKRLRVLGETSGLAIPPLEITDDARSRLVSAEIRGWDDSEDRIVVSESLLEADPEEQAWRLAACLGYWASPVPRRRRRQGWAIAGLFLFLYFGFGIFALSTNNQLPTWVTFAIGSGLAALAPLVAAAVSRRFHRALDESGQDVLSRAGYDPAAVARQVFGAQSDPRWWKRLHRREPTPSERLRAAGGSVPSVHPPLY